MITRRSLLAGAGAVTAVLLGGCASSQRPQPKLVQPPRPTPAFAYPAYYGRITSEPYLIPAVPVGVVEPRYFRQLVQDPTGERPGTIVVDPQARFLYLVREGGEALRYGIGVGRAGFAWSGRAIVQYKRHWPTWTPPTEMIARQPALEKYSAKNGGQPPGLNNPLGARALYLFQDGRDTLYRIHGSPEARSIGRAVSSGCIRLLNHEIIDLYDRVPEGTAVLVRPAKAPAGIVS